MSTQPASAETKKNKNKAAFSSSASAAAATAAAAPPPPPPPPTSLSLPAAQFAKLAPHSFLAAHLPQNRPSNRSPSECRAPIVHAGSLSHAHGSAIVRVGNTSVVCGVRGEILNARDAKSMTVLGGSGGVYATATSGGGGERQDESRDAATIADLGLLVPNIELATGCNPQHMPGNPPSTLAQSLTQRVITLLWIANLVSLRDLQIWAEGEGKAQRKSDSDEDEDEDMDEDDDSSSDSDEEARDKSRAAIEASVSGSGSPDAFWTLYIDILVISLDGSAFDAVWGAVLAALRDTVLPRARWDRDRESVLCDTRMAHAQSLHLRAFPVPLSFAIFDSSTGKFAPKKAEGDESGDSDNAIYVLADPDDFEEACCDQGVTVVVDGMAKKILRVEMGGGGLLDWRQIRGLMERSAKRWGEWSAALESGMRIRKKEAEGS